MGPTGVSRPLKRAHPPMSIISLKARLGWILLQESSEAWLADNAPSMGAALTFYAILSLTPVLIVATAIAGLGFWQKAAETEVLRYIQALVGEASARVLQSAMVDAHRPALGALASTIGIGTMLVGASGAFVELQDALNKIWRVQRKSGNILLSVIRQRILSFSLVVGTGCLLLLSLLSSALLGAAGRFTGHLIPWPMFLLEFIDFLFSFGVITLLLAAIFRLLPDTEIAWEDVWIGAAIASLLFTTGKVLIGLYLSFSAVASAYGAMSSPLVVLVWIYYSAQIFLFGAEFTHVYANKHGSRAAAAHCTSPDVGGVPICRFVSAPWVDRNGL